MGGQTLNAFWLGYEPSGTGAGPTLAQVPTGVSVVTLAFANLFPANVTCQGFLLKSNSEDSIRDGMAALKQASPGAKVLLSIIGTPVPPVGWNDGVTDPNAFADWLANLADHWGFDGFDVDNEDLATFPGEQFVTTVKAMRSAMPDALITLDTYEFARDREVIAELADDLSGINTMAYFLDFDGMTALVEQYAGVIEPAKISIGVKSAPVGPISQGTSLADTVALCRWNPSAGPKAGIMLWNLSQDIESVTGEPDGAWTRAIIGNLGGEA